MTMPTSARGYVDDNALLNDASAWGYGALIDALLEQIPELVWPRSIQMYGRMRRDPQLTAVIAAYTLAIRRARWAVDPAGCRDEVVAQVADDLGLPVLGTDEAPTGARRRAFTFAEHLRLALLDLTFGHMPFEQTYTEAAGRWRLAMVAERMPQTIGDVKLNRDGTINYVEQQAYLGNAALPRITTSDRRLVWYVNDREGSNYFGTSLLRPSYGPWLIKDQVLRVHATSIRRFGMGIPEVTAPVGATPQQVAEAQRLAAGVRVTEHAGVGLPNGFTMTLRGLQGTVPDAVAFITYLDRQMTRSTLTSLLDMATAERGARSLGETVMDLMVYSQQAVADAHADAATRQIVVPLVDANWGEDEPAPQIVVGDVGADLELTAQDIFWLTSYAALTPEPELENWIRQRYGIPTLDGADLAKLRADAAAQKTSTAGGE